MTGRSEPGRDSRGDAVFLVTNDMRTDSRVQRHAAAAVGAGFRVTVLALRSRAAPQDATAPAGYRVQRIGRGFQETPLYVGSRLLVRLPGRRARPSPSPHLSHTGPRPSLKRRVRDELEWRHLESIGRAFTRQLNRLRPRVVISNDIDTLVPAARHRWAHPDTRLVHDVHDLMADVNSDRSTWWTPTLRRVETRAIDAADVVVTVNPGLARVIGERYPGCDIAVVRNAVSLDFGVGPPRATRPDGPLRLAYAGGLGPGRGLITLVEAMARMPRGSTRLDVYGYGELAEVIPEVARARDLTDQVTVHPPVSQRKLIQRLAALEVGVLPIPPRDLNVTLSTPNKLYEYLAAGLAVATFDGTEIRDLVRSAGAGLSVDVSDPGAIASALDRFRCDPTYLVGCRVRAWEAFRTQYNWEHEQGTFLRALTGSP